MTSELPSVGDRLGRYRVGEVRSRAADRVVFRAVDDTGSPVDLTMLLRPPHPGDLERLYALSRVAGALRHPGILAVHDVGTTDGSTWYATAPAPAHTLVGRAPGRHLLPVIAAVAEALDHAHDHGVLHGTLTTRDVLIDDRGAAVVRWPAAAGFGRSPDRTDPGGDTPAARAPEQVAGRSPSHRTDLYLLGAVAFEALTGSAPYRPGEEPTPQDTGPPPRATARNPDLPTAVDQVFGTALASDPIARFGSGAALAEALRTAAAQPRAPRGRLWVLAAAALLLLVLAVWWPQRPSPSAVPVGAPILVGDEPVDIEDGAGAVWTANRLRGTVTRIDPTTGAAQEIPVGGRPRQLVVDGSAAWVRTSRQTVVRLDVATGATDDPITVALPITDMALGAGHLWLSHGSEATVTRVDLATRAPSGDPIPVGPQPGSMVLGEYLYVVQTGDGTLSRIDPRLGRVVGTPAPIGTVLGGAEIENGVVYVAADGGVVPVPERTFTPGPPIILPGLSYFEPAAGYLWLVFDDENVVRRMDLHTRTYVRQPVEGLGRDVGRARFAFGHLWLTLPERDEVVRLAPS